MTRYVVDIDEIVLRGVAAEEARDLGARVEQRLQELLSAPGDDGRRAAQGEAAPDEAAQRETAPRGREGDLADRVARSIWAQVHDDRTGAPTAAPAVPTAGADR